MFNDTFTESERRRIVEITGRRFAFDEKQELEDLIERAIIFEDYNEYCVVSFKGHPSQCRVEDEIKSTGSEGRRKKHEAGKFWREFYEGNETFAFQVLPASNLLFCRSNHYPKWPTLFNDQYGINAYLAILPEDVPRLVRGGVSILAIDYETMYKDDFGSFSKIYESAPASLQLQILTRLADDEEEQLEGFLADFEDEKKRTLLQEARFDIDNYVDIIEFYRSAEDTLLMYFKKQDKATQIRISGKFYGKEKTKLFQVASFDLIGVVGAEKIYTDYWELVGNSAYFSDTNNLVRFAKQMAVSSLPEADWDDEKDRVLESILKDDGVNLDDERRKNVHKSVAKGIKQPELNKQNGDREINFKSAVVKEGDAYLPTELKNLSAYEHFAEVISKAIPENQYWEAGDVEARISLSQRNGRFAVEIELEHSLWADVDSLYRKIANDYELRGLLFSEEQERISQEIAKMLQRMSTPDLGALREGIKPVSLKTTVDSLRVSYDDGDIYYFASDEPLCIDFRSADNETSFNGYIVNVGNASPETALSHLVKDGWLEWDADKVSEALEACEREIAGDSVGLRRSRIFSRDDNFERYQQLCFYHVELSEGKSLPLLDAQNNFSLVRVANKSELFAEAYDRLVSSYR